MWARKLCLWGPTLLVNVGQGPKGFPFFFICSLLSVFPPGWPLSTCALLLSAWL